MRVAIMFLSATLLSSAYPVAPTLAQESARPEPADVAGAVEAVRQIIGQIYVRAERRPALDAVLADGLSSGRYSVSDPATLAERINADLKRVGQDQHLTFRYDPAEAVGINDRQTDPALRQLRVRAANHGVTGLRVLPGNVRLMTYDNFHWVGDESAAALDQAVSFLAGGDAIIIDLRGNSGGSPSAVRRLISYFLPPETPLMTFYTNGGSESEREVSLAELPMDRLIGKPLYLLTGSGTASAAEAFAGHVAGYRLGDVVGAKTSGAGYTAMTVTMDSQFVLSVSVGRPVLASTGADWESVGVAPTISVDESSALDVAHAAALRRLASKAIDDTKAELESIAEVVEARSSIRTPTLPLPAYAGTYGDRIIFLENGRLYSRRSGKGSIPLIALGGNRFAFDSDPLAQFDFETQGEAVKGLRYGRVGGRQDPLVERSA